MSNDPQDRHAAKTGDAAKSGRPRGRLGKVLLALVGLVLFAVFLALGVWQLERRVWKLNLIAAVNERVAAAPIAAPGPDAWPSLSFDGDEYRHVSVSGSFEKGKSVFVQATTDYGGGFWLVTPLRDQRGFTVLINRGFVPSRDFPADRGLSGASTEVTGLLRMSQPGGAFLRSNDPAAGRWYSRDVEAIAAAKDVAGPVAPYFVDAGSPLERPPLPNAEMGAPPPGTVSYPVEGLTRTTFRNQHLQYALTWFALAGLVVVAAVIVVRNDRRRRA
ncbi:SURF1 family protein [Jiella mangrovi]|uniref:SURF1-like protein n=1 Tax=Jiella mangrovi TaxID=2821407 RepID=A0ABS4BL74_9HYPH|nr:SURF1 family protein [Jiella mangrovi]MBP0617493.1 SURF1 family protein [Jiella mangrovi]